MRVTAGPYRNMSHTCAEPGGNLLTLACSLRLCGRHVVRTTFNLAGQVRRTLLLAQFIRDELAS